jgi:galactofuranose transport system substrate-binding protein
LRGTPSEPADDRQRGFAGAISADPKFRIVAAPSAEFTRHKGEQVMGAILAANRGIHVVYAHNDDMGIGALRAIEKAGLAPGRDIQIITIDGTRDALTALAGGKLNFVVECSPHLGPQLIDLVKKVHAGGPVERRVWTEETTFDQRQAAEALPRRQY